MKDESDLIMESYIEAVAELAKKQGFKKAVFAQKLWPESELRVASNRWRNMRTRVKVTDKPQGLLVSDAHRMARVLGQNISYLFILAQEKVLKKQAAQAAQESGNKPAAAEIKRKRGRPRKTEA